MNATDIGVLGSINRDVIHHADGRVDQSLGGVLFTACALAHLGGGRLRTWLFARVAADLVPDIEARLRRVPGLRLEALIPDSGGGYRCRIEYDRDGHKSEVLTGHLPPLTLGDLGEYLPRLRGLLVNFITGFELELDTLRQVRRRLRGPLMIDLHSLTLGRDAAGCRYRRGFDDWTEWVRLADVVQMNADESRVLGAPAGDDGFGAWAVSLLDLGPRAVVITQGAAGAVAAYRDDAGSIRSVRQDAHALADDGPLDPTGCGDVFLGALGASLVSGEGLPAALGRAARAAARNCTLIGIDDLHRLV